MAVLFEVDPARQLVGAEAGLVAEFPTVEADDIHLLVMLEARHFDAAPVRDFVSILVAKTVRSSLRARSRQRRETV